MATADEEDNITTRSEAGPRRCAVRDQWNIAELDIERLFEQYDADKTERLEMPEFRKLLQDFNGGAKPKKEEIAWMMKIADTDFDNTISKEELHYAMKAWNGYTHIQSKYADLFDKYDKDKSKDLDVEELQKLLIELNEGQTVTYRQAKKVLEAADVMGNNKISRYELLGAVGVWYVSIGREPTPDMDVALVALKGRMNELPWLNYFQICICLIVGALCIYNGRNWELAVCGKPLDLLLFLHGVGQIIQSCLAVVSLVLSKGRQVRLLFIVVILKAVSVLFCLGVTITGIHFVRLTHPAEQADLSANPDSCEVNLWRFSWWIFVLPLIIWGTLVTGLCCCACVAAARKKRTAKDTEESLQHRDRQASMFKKADREDEQPFLRNCFSCGAGASKRRIT